MTIQSCYKLYKVTIKQYKYQYHTMYTWYLGREVRKPVFGVSHKVRFQPACSATGTSWKILISLVARFDMVLSKKPITKALIRLRGYAGWSAPLLFAYSRRQVFSWRGPSNPYILPIPVSTWLKDYLWDVKNQIKQTNKIVSMNLYIHC